jgi:hypothetical protein
VGNFLVYTGYFLAVVIMLLGVYFARQNDLVLGAILFIAGIIMAYVFLMRRPEY